MNSAENCKAPENEQTICLECGLCCDGTLFGHAELGPGERGNLPAMIEQNVFVLDGKDFFRLPCLYFRDKCTIYDRPRAEVCGSYRCRLLSDMKEERITAVEALEIIRRAREMRHSLVRAFNLSRTGNEMLPFAVILRELGKRNEPSAVNDFTDSDFYIIQARCNIFEALLIKHFRPAGDFEKIVMRKLP